jgi:hypothetical protein
LAAASLVAGCAEHRTFEDEVLSTHRDVRDAFSAHTFVADEPVELKTQGPVAIDIDNFAGDIVVRADRKVERTFVEVRRVSTHGFGRWSESREALDDAQWTATLEPRVGGGETLIIRTDTPNPEEHFHHMEILVVAPALDTVKIRTTNGDVTIIENQGAVDVETTRGDVRMMTPWPMTGPMTIITSGAIVRERELGTLEQLILTQICKTSLMMGKLVPFVLVGYLQMTVVLVLAWAIFDVPLVGSIPLLSSSSKP